MNVRAVVAEVLALGMTVIFFINIFIQAPLGIWGRIAPFIIFMILAAYLIRGVLREAEQKEALSTLNSQLEQKVAEQTKEIRTAYDLEKKARKELEKLNETKDQFIMITQHHLRTPLMVIADGMSTISEGAKNIADKSWKSSMERMNRAVDRLKNMVNDFLSITTIKIGTPILNVKPENLQPVIVEILEELRDEIDQRKIKINFADKSSDWPAVLIDRNKMREVLLIILENAIKYNHDNGTIDIGGSKQNDKFVISIANTGIALAEEDKKRINSGLFYRSEKAKLANPTGMGIGLSVVRAMMKAHGGSFSIDSKGENGAKVALEFKLPI